MKKWIVICLVSVIVLFCTTSVAKARMMDPDIQPVRIVNIFEKTFIKDFGHAKLFSGIHSKPMIVLSFDADVRENLIPVGFEHNHPEESSEIIEESSETTEESIDPSESEQQSEEISSQTSSKPEDSNSRPQESSSKPQESSSSKPQESSSSRPQESSSKPQESSSRPQESSSKPQESSSQVQESSSSKPEESSSKPQESSSKTEESSSQSESSQTTHSHDYKLTKTENATCEENGYREYACNCGQAYRETISATGHAWKPQYTTVHHDEEGHWETVEVTTTEEVEVWVVDKAAWDEVVETGEWQFHQICKGCGAFLDELSREEKTAHKNAHMDNGVESGHYTNTVWVIIGTETIHHPEEGHYETKTQQVIKEEQRWIVDRAAYDEKVLTGYLCSTCGKGKE